MLELVLLVLLVLFVDGVHRLRAVQVLEDVTPEGADVLDARVLLPEFLTDRDHVLNVHGVLVVLAVEQDQQHHDQE